MRIRFEWRRFRWLAQCLLCEWETRWRRRETASAVAGIHEMVRHR